MKAIRTVMGTIAVMTMTACELDLTSTSAGVTTPWCTSYYSTGQVEVADLDDAGAVKEYLCRPGGSTRDIGIYVVTIDRSLPSSEM